MTALDRSIEQKEKLLASLEAEEVGLSQDLEGIQDKIEVTEARLEELERDEKVIGGDRYECLENIETTLSELEGLYAKRGEEDE